MPKCEFAPENPNHQVECRRSACIKILKAADYSGMPIQDIIAMFCLEGSEEDRIDNCPGYCDLVDSGVASDFAVQVMPEVQVRKQGTLYW